MNSMNLPQSEAELVSFLDALDDRLQAAAIRRNVAQFNRLIGEPHEDMEELNRSFAAIMLDPIMHKVVESWRERITDERLKRRFGILERDFLSAQIENNAELFKLADEIEGEIVKFQPEVRGRRMSRNELGRLMETAPDRGLRQDAYFAGKKLDDAIEERVVTLFRKRNELAQQLGRADYVTLGLALQELDEQELRSYFEQLRALTQDAWDEALSQARQQLHVARLESWDMSYYLHSLLPSPRPERFPKAGILPTFEAVLAQAGGNLKALPIKVYDRDIPYGGLCMAIDYGKDIRILANPRDGLQWYDALFHEFGHGIQASLLDASSFMVASGDPSFFWEGVAGVYERIILEPAILRERFGLTEEEIAQALRLNRLQRIRSYRSIAATCLLEWAVYRGDPNPRQTAADLFEEYMGIRPPAAAGWAGNTLFTTHPLYSQNYLMMDIMAFQTAAAVRERFGSFPHEQLFDFVNRHYVAAAGWTPWREKILAATGKPLSVEDIAAYFR